MSHHRLDAIAAIVFFGAAVVAVPVLDNRDASHVEPVEHRSIDGSPRAGATPVVSTKAHDCACDGSFVLDSPARASAPLP